MAYKFTFTLNGDPSTTLEETKALIIQNGGTMTGDAKSGEFSASGVRGSYQIDGQEATITINKKPMIVSNGFIEKKVKEYFT